MKIFISISFWMLIVLEASSQSRFTFFNEEFKTVRERRAVYFTNERFDGIGEEKVRLRSMKSAEQDLLVTFLNGKIVSSESFDPDKNSHTFRFVTDKGKEIELTSEEFLLPLDSSSFVKEYLLEQIKNYEKAKPLEKGYRVFATFIVTAEGEAKYIDILKGEYPELNKEVIMKIGEKEQWYPKFVNGEPVTVRVVLPFLFLLDNNSSLEGKSTKP